MLGVMHDKYVNGCNTLEGEANLAHFQNNCHDVMSLEDMLTRQFTTDAHFTSYNLTNFTQWPLLNKSILPEIRQNGEDIVLAYMTFDWDNVAHGEWTEESRAKFIALLNQCTDPVINSWAAIYTTHHGARLIYRMSRRVPVDEAEQHLSWMIHHFWTNGFGEDNGFGYIDKGCKDYTRRMRCPNVIRDDVPKELAVSWEQPYYDITTRPAVLDMDLVGKRSAKAVASKTHFNKDKMVMPDHAALDTLLVSKANGREKQTDFVKRAKKALKESPYVDVLFNDASPDWSGGHRNDEIVKMLGFIVPPLLRKVHASVQQIFALAIQPLLTLNNDQDWVAHGWNALLDIYEREVNKLNLDKEQEALKVSEEIDILDKMVEGMKEWCNDPALILDEESARQFVKSNCMLSAEKYLYLMNEEGRFPDFVIGKDQVISRVRKTFLGKVIDTTKISYTGELVDVPVTNLVNSHASPVAEIHMRPVGGLGGYVDDLNGEKPIMVISTFCRNDELEPLFDAAVDQWLQHLGGEHYIDLCTWIAWALAFDEGLICALSMEGASSSGKKLFTEGLSECLKGSPAVAGPEAMYHQSSAFLKTPFLVVNENWPKYHGASSAADKFKSITGGDGIIVNEKFKPEVRVLCPVRLIMSANDDGIIRELLSGKDMGYDNRKAIGDRLYHFKVTDKAEAFLRSIGGRGYTARQGQRWIRPDSGPDPSNYIVAKHFLWLYHNRPETDPSQRFLVMGNCAPGASSKQNIIEHLLADNNHTPLVAQAIRELVDCDYGYWSTFVKVNPEHTRIWITRHSVHKYIKEKMEERVSERDVYSGLQNLMVGTEPDKIGPDKIHYYEVSVELLAKIATEQGILSTKIRNIYMNRIRAGLSE